jgi:integrase
VNNELKMLRIFGRWLHDRNYHDGKPFDRVRDVVDDAPAAGRSLTLPEFHNLVCATQSTLQLWTVVTAAHGLRRGESNTLRPEDISTEDGYLHIRVHYDEEGRVVWRPKFGKVRLVPIVERMVPLMKHVQDLRTDGFGRVFGVHDRRKAMKKALTRADLTGHVRFHDLRHTAYTHLKSALLTETDEQVALSEIRLIFGHADATMDRVFDHRTVERLRVVADRSPLPKTALAALGEGAP